MRTRCLIVFGAECASNNGIHTQRVEIGPGHELSVDLFEVCSACDPAMCAKHDAVNRRNVGEYFVLLTKFPEARIREKLPATIGQAVDAAPPLPLSKQHELLRIAYRQITQQNRIQ